MTIKEVFNKLKFIEFPLEKIKSISLNRDFTELRMNGISKDASSHTVNKEEHGTWKNKYSTKFEGFDVEFSYVFCPECKEVRNKRVALFDNIENTVYIWRYD